MILQRDGLRHHTQRLPTLFAFVGVAFLVMLLWFIVALVFRWHFQFGIRSLLVLVVVVAVPCSWLAGVTLLMEPLPSRPENRDESPFPWRAMPTAVLGLLGLLFSSSAIPLLGELDDWIERQSLAVREMQ